MDTGQHQENRAELDMDTAAAAAAASANISLAICRTFVVSSLSKPWSDAAQNMFFLAGFPDGQRKHRTSNKTRVPVYLDQPAWFCSRLTEVAQEQGVDTSVFALSRKRARQEVLPDQCVLEALVRARPGRTCAGVATPWTDEEQLLWKYYGKPLACFSVEATDVVMLKQPVPIASARSLQGNVRLTRIFFQPNVPVAEQDTVVFRQPGGAEHRLGSILEEWGIDHAQLPVLWLPSSVVFLGEESAMDFCVGAFAVCCSCSCVLDAVCAVLACSGHTWALVSGHQAICPTGCRATQLRGSEFFDPCINIMPGSYHSRGA